VSARTHLERANLAGRPLGGSLAKCTLRYSINVTLDGCCDHRAIPADEDLHRHAIENLGQADALLFGRVTYEMMEGAKKYVVSSTLDRVDWNAQLVRGDMEKAVQQLKRELGKGLFVGGVTLPCVDRAGIDR
jgi:hypothetical protein